MTHAQELSWSDELPQKEQTFTRFRGGMGAFWDLVSTERSNAYLLMGAIVVSKLFEFAIPLAFTALFDAAQSITQQGGVVYSLWPYVALMLVLGICNDVFTRLVRAPLFFMAAIRLEKELPVSAHRKLLALSQGYHARNSIGKNSAKITKGCDKTISIADRLAWGLVPNVLYVALNVAILLYFDWRLALTFLGFAIPAVWINLRSYERFNPLYLEWDKLKEVANARFFDIHRNGATVRDFVAERYEEHRFSSVREDMYALDVDVTWKLQVYLVAVGVCMHFAFVTTVVLSVYLALSGEVTLGTTAFVAMTTNATRQNLWDMINNYTHIMRDVVSVERLAYLMAEKEDVINHRPGAMVPSTEASPIIFRDVTFGYRADNMPILRNFHLEISPGSMVALVGASGSGKTTIAKLIARVYDVNKGSIEFAGHDIRAWDRDSYRRLFATVSQSVEIFDTTIRANIAYAMENVPDVLIQDALRAAHLDMVLSDQGRFPQGMGTRVGENGVQLSGGERQRVGIARAYLALRRGAKFLILDEATSALDSHAERVIQEFVDALRKERSITIIAIAHRLATIQRADDIIVLKKGEVAERGTHSRLLKKEGLYASLVRLQSLGAVRE